MIFSVECHWAVWLFFIAAASGAPLTPHQQEPSSPDKTHQFKLTLRNEQASSELTKRGQDSILSIDTNIHQVLLTFPLNLAGQDLVAVVDTGSYSTWFLNANASENEDANTKAQSGKLCSAHSCITLNDDIELTSEDYYISYMSSFGSSGTWANAPLKIGNAPPVDFKFGIAETINGTASGYSWSGFGYSDLFEENSSQLIEVLKREGVIDKRLFALEYDPIESWERAVMGHGSLFIGGYNNQREFEYLNFISSKLTAVKINGVIGNNGNFVALEGSQSVLFDSGSTNLIAKREYIDALLSGIEMDATHKEFFKCSAYEEYQVKFDLGNGKVLQIPILNISWNNYRERYDLCQLMISELEQTESYEIVFGQYMLKNLVTIFDIEDKRIGIAVNADGVSIS